MFASFIVHAPAVNRLSQRCGYQTDNFGIDFTWQESSQISLIGCNCWIVNSTFRIMNKIIYSHEFGSNLVDSNRLIIDNTLSRQYNT